MGRVVIIGGGIAGLSLASALARRGREVVLFEQGPRLAGQSSARSAGMFRLANAEALNVRLALRSLELGNALVPGFVSPVGGTYLCASASEQRAILDAAAFAGVRATEELPAWIERCGGPAVWSPADGLIDVDRLVSALVRDAQEHGANLRRDSPVQAIQTSAGRASGVVSRGEAMSAEVVVDAAGAWSEALPGTPELRGQIRTKRRHLFILEPSDVPLSGIVWDLGQGIYVRPHPEGILACACDESVFPVSEDVPVDPSVEETLRAKLVRWAPALAQAKVRRAWAGQRPMTPDHRFIVGPDPALPGLFRLTGFGGHGMAAGLAAGELAARLLSGEAEPEGALELSPARPSLSVGAVPTH